MAKFAMIISKYPDIKSIKAFEKKYTEKNLKKNFKCNSVTLLDDNVNSWDALEANFNIKEQTFKKLSCLLHSVDMDALIDYGHVNYSTRKFFIFGDDVMQSEFSFDFLSDDVYISAFELDQNSADELAEKLDDFNGVEYRFGQLNEAQDLYNSLENISSECSLNIFRINAEDDLDDALNEAETEFENLKAHIQNIINSSWATEVNS